MSLVYERSRSVTLWDKDGLQTSKFSSECGSKATEISHKLSGLEYGNGSCGSSFGFRGEGERSVCKFKIGDRVAFRIGAIESS